MIKKRKYHGIGLDIEKNVMRYSVKKNNKWIYGEIVNNGSFFKGDKLSNVDQFVNCLKEVYKKTQVSSSNLIIATPNSKLLIRQIPVQTMKSEKEIREYLFFELGESIPLPFDRPIFDLLVYDRDESKKKKKKKKRSNTKAKSMTVKKNQLFVDGKVSVIVTSESFLEKIGDSISKGGGKLVGVDSSSLAYGRVFQKRINWSQNFILVELSGGIATVTIFEQFVPVYVQYENYNQVNWKYLEKNGASKMEFSASTEIEALDVLGMTIQNISEYFTTELSVGKILSHVYLVGGHPLLTKEAETMIQKHNTLTVKALRSPLKDSDGAVPERFLLAAGLSMKEV